MRFAIGVLLAVSCYQVANAFLVPAGTPLCSSFNPSVAVASRSSKAPLLGLRMATPIVNAAAPAFELPSNKGKNLTLKDFAGKWVVLYFYPKVFTSGCTCEAEGFEKDAAEIRKLGAEIVGVSTDPVDQTVKFTESYKLSFPLLSDAGGKVADAYGSAIKIPLIGTFANRKTFIIDPKGQLRYVFDKVNAKEHSAEVISKLKEIKA